MACASLATSLGKNRKFRDRVSTKLDPLDLDIRFDFLTKPELITRLKLRHNQADFSSRREKHLKQAVRTSKEVIATANDRAVRALNDVRTLLSGLCAASEAATASERQAAKAAVALAQSAQEHAELQAEHKHLQVYSQSSLQAMALATVAVQEELQAECTIEEQLPCIWLRRPMPHHCKIQQHPTNLPCIWRRRPMLQHCRT